MQNSLIGIVGGAGPYAAIDIEKKIFDYCVEQGAKQDQDFVSLINLQNTQISIIIQR